MGPSYSHFRKGVTVKMMRQVVSLLSVVTVALALGDGMSYHSKKNTKNIFQKQEPHQFASVASFNSAPKQPAPQTAPVQYAPAPYSFNYEAEGSARQESSDANGKVTGSYTVTNEDGSVRVVKYVADENGFRADIDTDEAGTKTSMPANADIRSKFVESSAPKKYSAGASSYKGQYEQKPIQFSLDGNNGGYSYNYESRLDDGGSSSQSERSDGAGTVTGRYSLSNADGRQRQVDYSSGSGGFQAKIDTNEFGTKSDSPANVQFYSSADQQAPATSTFSKTSAFSHQKQKINFNSAPIEQQPIQATKFSTSPVKQQPIQDYAQFESKPSPYAFSYDAQLEDGSSSRQESSDASGKVVGSYSLSAADGRKRTIDYIADHQGFRATVNTNEFGTKSDSPADTQFYSNAPVEAPKHYSSQRKGASSVQQFSQKPIPAAFPVEQSPVKSALSGAASDSQFKNVQQTAVQYGNQPDQYAPFDFNYVAQLEDGGSSSRKESGDGSGKVTGSYSLSAGDSRRTVDYSADQSGFRASVNTNEFGTKNESPADVQFYSSAVQEEPAQQFAANKPANAGGHYSAGHYSSASKTNFATQQKVEPHQFASQPIFNSAPQPAAPQYAPAPSPYSFNYEAEGSARQESSDANGKVTGSYTVTNEDGSVRVVKYVADENGFRADIDTDEAGTKTSMPANADIRSKFVEPQAPAYSAPVQQQKPVLSKANFPQRTHSQKSSMISQKNIDAWSR